MRFTELLDRRFRTPEWEAWRTSINQWIRATVNKLAGKQVAAQYGATVPRILWQGEHLQQVPWAELPESYAIKSAWGSASGKVVVVRDGKDVLRNLPATPTDILKLSLMNWQSPLYIEECVEDEAGRVPPVDYKCMCFGSHVESIMVFDRTGDRVTCNCYTPTWEPIPTYLINKRPEGEYIEPPACLEQIVSQASQLGKAFGTFVRCDFYATPTGPMFGEFCCNPSGCRSLHGRKVFHDWADEHLGKVWEETLGGERL